MITPTQQAKITQLESLCPDAHFEFDPVLNKVHITSPTTHGNTMLLVVDLPFEGDNFDAWIDKEISSRLPHPLAKSPYRLICPLDGPTLITLENYNTQMQAADSPWHCPKCGGIAQFDNRYYELHSPLDEPRSISRDDDDDDDDDYDYDEMNGIILEGFFRHAIDDPDREL